MSIAVHNIYYNNATVDNSFHMHNRNQIGNAPTASGRNSIY